LGIDDDSSIMLTNMIDVREIMTTEPSYLGTLNAIVNGERRGNKFLAAWSQNTARPNLARVLHTVALRDAEHAATFEKRINELGFDLQETSDPGFENDMAIALSPMDDIEKFERSGIGQHDDNDAQDRLLMLLADKSIDPRTAELLGRFIAEERDSGRILRKAYLALKEDTDLQLQTGNGDDTQEQQQKHKNDEMVNALSGIQEQIDKTIADFVRNR
jgi:rubrerythrin